MTRQEEPRTPAVQLRIDFPQPVTPVTLGLALRGLTVEAGVWDGSVEDACTMLRSCGVSLRIEPDRGVVFPLVDLGRLAETPENMRIEALGSIAPLVHYALCAPEAPATVTVHEGLRLSWYDGSNRMEEVLDEAAAAALPASELPFVATEEAWERLERLAGIPLLLGRAQVNHDGFIEIATTKPQHLEAAPLSGLFRIDATHYGLSLAYAQEIQSINAIEWTGPRPKPVRTPQIPQRLEGLLSSHLREDLPVLLHRLAVVRGQVLAYPSGMGRRILALSALEALGSFPALVVTPPWSLWVWQRNAELMGREVSLTRSDADIRLITYLDLAHKARFDAFEAVIYDDLSGPDASVPRARRAMAGLGVFDAYRIGICSSWPQDPEDACALLDLVRPGEFDLLDHPLSQRYPLRPVQRAEEHATAYLLRRPPVTSSEGPTRRSEVHLVSPTHDQVRALAELERTSAPRRRLLEAGDIISAGTSSSLSPKIAAVVELARDAYVARRRLAVVTRSKRAATLLRASLAAWSPKVVDEMAQTSDFGPMTVVLWQRSLCDLRGFDEVVFLDYPWSTAVIDTAVGHASVDLGPRRVVVLHSPGTIDDRLAAYAARRGELDRDDPSSPPTDDELEYLLARRW